MLSAIRVPPFDITVIKALADHQASSTPRAPPETARISPSACASWLDPE